MSTGHAVTALQADTRTPGASSSATLVSFYPTEVSDETARLDGDYTFDAPFQTDLNDMEAFARADTELADLHATYDAAYSRAWLPKQEALIAAEEALLAADEEPKRSREQLLRPLRDLPRKPPARSKQLSTVDTFRAHRSLGQRRVEQVQRNRIG